MITKMTEWKEFTGSDEQIAEINACKKFKLLRNDCAESRILEPPFMPSNMPQYIHEMEIEVTTHYMIIEY